MIGTSDGQQYESMSHYMMGLGGSAAVDASSGGSVGASTEPAGAFKSNPGTSGPLEDKGTPEAINGPISDRLGAITRDNHVPLVASALTDQDGKMYGMAIDSRIPPKPEYDKHLWNHEAFENDYMNDLVKNGMISQDAYHKAHDWSTARESAAVTAEFGEKGLDDYKQYWRDASAIAAEPSDKPRHPDAHTTKHGLDESELGKQYAMNDNTKTDATHEAEEKALGEMPVRKGEPVQLPFAGRMIRPTQADNMNKPSRQIPDDPYVEAKIMEGWNKMVKEGNKPNLKVVEEPEKIAAPGIMAHDGTVFTGINHGAAYEKFSTSGKRLAPGGSYDGFLTSKGRFVSRKEALDIAKQQDQLKSKYPVGKQLLSEDLQE